MNIWHSLFPHSADSHNQKHAWLHKLMPTAYDFIWLNKISKTQQWELQNPHRLPATNGLSVAVASEQSAARQGLLFAGQGHGLNFCPRSPALHYGFCFSCLWWAFGELPRVFLQQLLPYSAMVNCPGSQTFSKESFIPTHHVELTFVAYMLVCIDQTLHYNLSPCPERYKFRSHNSCWDVDPTGMSHNANYYILLLLL